MRYSTRALVLAILCSAAFVIAILTSLTVGYETSDDVGMMMRLRGVSKSVEPSEFLFNTHISLSLFLKHVQVALPGLDIYPMYLVGVHWLALSAITYAMMLLAGGWIGTALVVVALMLDAPFIVSLSFSTTAFVAGAAGVALLAAVFVRTDLSRRHLACACAWAVLMLLLSAVTREKVVVLVAALALAPAVILMWQYGLRNFLPVIASGLVAAALAGASFVHDRAYYRADPVWHDFHTLKKTKSAWTEYVHVDYTDETKPIFDELGVSKNDFRMMQNSFNLEGVVFSLAKSRELVSRFPQMRLTMNWTATLDRIVGNYRENLPYLLTVIGVALAAGRAALWPALLALAVPIAPLLFLEAFYKPAPLRVSRPIFGFQALWMLLCFAPMIEWRRARAWLGAVAVTAAGAVTLDRQIARSALNASNHADVERWLAEMQPSPDDLHFIWGASFPYNWVAPFDPPMDDLLRFHTVGIGVGLNSPVSLDQMKRFGVTDAYRDLVVKPNVYLVNLKADARPDLYARFMAEHYGMKVVFDTRYENKYFRVLKPRVDQPDRPSS